MPQQFSNHAKYYAPHHFMFYPVILVCLGGSIYCAVNQPELRLVWLAITAAFVMITWVSVMLRQHYALGNQNRIVRLEMRLRYYQLTQQRLEDIEDKLTFSQIAALRFASDAELPALVKRALAENLPSTDIKKAIKNWTPDYMRV